MDKSTLIGIVGILLTIVFGFLSIDLFKRKKYPGKITYVKLTLIDLLNNIANNFREIKLLHQDQPINKNIIYIKGAILNNGDIDINSKLTEKDISIKLPDKCKWLDIKPTEYSEGLSPKIKIDNLDTATFDFDLFRRNEFIQFEGLIESEDKFMASDVLENQLSFSHRIENTSKIQKKVLLSEKEIKKKKKYATRTSILVLILIFFVSFTYIFNLFGIRAENIYYNEINNKNISYSATLENETVVLKTVDNEDKLYISIEEFNNRYKASSKKLTLWEKFKEQYWIIAVQIGLFIVSILWEVYEINNAKRLMKILNKSSYNNA
ncbi:hypothetical protein [Wenyingzhuangia sp. IMCC45574]